MLLSPASVSGGKASAIYDAGTCGESNEVLLVNYSFQDSDPTVREEALPASVTPGRHQKHHTWITDMEMTAEEQQQVEEQVERLLSGQGSEVTVCDVGLEQSKPATLRKNVTYIVCAVIFNEKVNRGHHR